MVSKTLSETNPREIRTSVVRCELLAHILRNVFNACPFLLFEWN